MARKTASKSTLEWITDRQQIQDGVSTNGRIGLRLDRDEVAEIHKIVVTIDPVFLDDVADLGAKFFYAVSLDPDVIADPETVPGVEDLEVFAHGVAGDNVLVGAPGQTIETHDFRHDTDFHVPVLAGSDIGWVVKGSTTINCDFTIIVYLTRRRAKANEKFNVLLSRR